MDKLTAIKIKYDDGTYSDEIPVSVLAENVEWDSTHTLVDVLGSIDVDVTGTIQDQISQLFNEKVNYATMQNYVSSNMNTYITSWLNTNVNPIGSAVSIDKSLTIEGMAADAKETGRLNKYPILSEQLRIEDFEEGAINESGNDSSYGTKRIRLRSWFYTPKDILISTLYTNPLHEFIYLVFKNPDGTFHILTWSNGIFLPANSVFRFMIEQRDQEPERSIAQRISNLIVDIDVRYTKVKYFSSSSSVEEILAPIYYRKGGITETNLLMQKSKYKNNSMVSSDYIFYFSDTIEIGDLDSGVAIYWIELDAEFHKITSHTWSRITTIPKNTYCILCINLDYTSNKDATIEETLFPLKIKFDDNVSINPAIETISYENKTLGNDGIVGYSQLRLCSCFIKINNIFGIKPIDGYKFICSFYDKHKNFLTMTAFFTTTRWFDAEDMGAKYIRVLIAHPNDSKISFDEITENWLLYPNFYNNTLYLKDYCKDGINNSNASYAPKYPQCSLISYKKAYNQGYRNFLCHIQFTADNIPVVYHDVNINNHARTANGETLPETTPLSSLTLEQLNQYDFGIEINIKYKGTKIFLFEDLLKFIKYTGTSILIEPTIELSSSHFDIMSSLIKKYGLDKQCGYFAYNPTASNLIKFKENFPESTLAYWINYQLNDDQKLARINSGKNLKNNNNTVFIYSAKNIDFTDEQINAILDSNQKLLIQVTDQQTWRNNDPSFTLEVFNKFPYIYGTVNQILPCSLILKEMII